MYDSIKPNHDLNEFRTPAGLADRMVDIVSGDLFNLSYSPIYTLDPGANNGILGAAVRRKLGSIAHITGVELMAGIAKPDAYDRYHWGQDFLDESTLEGNEYDFIIANPPFTVNKQPTAELFVRKSLRHLGSDGVMVFLLRSNFMHSQKRAKLFEEYPPRYVYALTRRPSFYREDVRMDQYGKSNTNEHDYSVFVWQKGWAGETTLRWLNWEYKPTLKQLPLFTEGA